MFLPPVVQGQIILGNICTFFKMYTMYKRSRQKQAPIAHYGDLDTKSLCSLFVIFCLRLQGTLFWPSRTILKMKSSSQVLLSGSALVENQDSRGSLKNVIMI